MWESEAPAELGMTLFLCVFLIPFVTVGTGMTVLALINLVLKELLLQPHRERPLEMLPNLPWLSRSRDR